MSALLVAAALVVAGCTSTGNAGNAESAESVDPAQTEPIQAETTASADTTIENYPDAQTRALAARARERRPVDNSALPPRHLEPERHPESLVDRTRIVSGGPPPDGIPSIDAPSFSPVDTIDWLADEEPVAVLTVDGQTRIYPAQIMLWHEIVNDRINDRPITMTYCPLCNSVVAFDATVTAPDGTVTALEFGTSGALFQSALVMYDRQTESLWTHFDGRSVIGTMIGAELEILPAAMISWVDAAAAHPNALVLDRPIGELARPYGTAPYPNYETAPPTDAYLSDEVDDRLDPKQRVVGINLGDTRFAVDRSDLEADRVITIDPGTDPEPEAESGAGTESGADGPALVILWEPGTVSALDGRAIDDGLAVGAVGVFLAEIDGEPLSFTRRGGSGDAADSIVDEETGSTWNVSGQAVAGPLAGRSLPPVVHLDTFWFAWSRYHPDTEVIG